jgi:hypothetical protein
MFSSSSGTINATSPRTAHSSNPFCGFNVSNIWNVQPVFFGFNVSNIWKDITLVISNFYEEEP